MSAADNIAATILEQGRIRAQGLAAHGDIYGHLAQSLGQIPGQVLQQTHQFQRQQQEEQTQQQEATLRSQQIAQGQYQQDAQKRAQQLNETVNGLLHSQLLTPENRPKLRDAFTQANVPLQVQSEIFKSLDEVDASADRIERTQIDNTAELAHSALIGGASPESAASVIAYAQMHPGRVDRDAVTRLQTAASQGQDIKPILEEIRGRSEKFRKASEPVKLGEGDRLVNPLNSAVLAENPPKPPPATEPSLAVDAANPQSPTAARSKAALDALRADTRAKEIREAADSKARLGIEQQNANTGSARERREAGQAASFAAPSTLPDVAPGQKNDAYLQSLTAPVAAQVKALAEGRMQVPTGAALRSPYWQNLIQAVAKYDPSFDTVNYNARSKTRAAFTSGKEASQVNALNTVIGHLDGLSQAADALQNSDSPLYNSVANRLSKALGRPAVTNFDTIKKAVADEVTKVWRQSGGTESDVRSAQANLDAANSPAQLHGAIATYGDLLESKLGALADQYKQGMGSDPINLVTPQSRATLTKLEGRAGKAPAVTPPTTTAGPKADPLGLFK